MLFSAFGAALFILSLGALDPLTRGAVDLPALVPPFGASTIIVFFAPDTPASRPWNIVLGHLGSALIALAVTMLVPAWPAAHQAALAISGAALFMVATRSIHPPGGATALFAVLSGRSAGNVKSLLPLLLGCLMLVAIRWLLDAVLAYGARRSDDDATTSGTVQTN